MINSDTYVVGYCCDFEFKVKEPESLQAKQLFIWLVLSCYKGLTLNIRPASQIIYPLFSCYCLEQQNFRGMQAGSLPAYDA